MEYKAKFIVIIAMFILINCKSDYNSNSQIAKKDIIFQDTIKVKTEKAYFGKFSQEIITNGKIRAKRKAIIPFLLNEQIIDVKVKNGQYVKKNQTIVLLDSSKYKNQLLDIENQFEKSKIDLEDFLLGQGYQIQDLNSIPDHILKMAKIKSGYNQMKIKLDNAKRNMSNTIIKAPIKGIIANLEAKSFNSTSSFDNCCDILDHSMMKINFHVLESELMFIKKATKFIAIPYSNSKQNISGKITSINPQIDNNGMIKISGEIINSKNELYDGMNVKIVVKKEISNCLIIPKSAILNRQNRTVIFIHEKGLAKWKYVDIGYENSSQVTIVNNSIKKGQEIIIDNNFNLAHDTPVICY